MMLAEMEILLQTEYALIKNTLDLNTVSMMF